jgi:hypothetical protein
MKLFVGSPEKGYDLAGIEDVPLWAMVRIERQLGLSADTLPPFLEKAMTAFQAEETSEKPELLMAVGLLVWMTRMAAGERIDFEDATDFPMRTVRLEMSEAERAAADEAAAKAATDAQQVAALVEGGEGVRPTGPAGGTPTAG